MNNHRFIAKVAVLALTVFAGSVTAIALFKTLTAKSSPLPVEKPAVVQPLAKPETTLTETAPAETEEDSHTHSHEEADSDDNRLSDEENEDITLELQEIVQDSDPGKAMEHLQEMMNLNPAVVRSCHGFVHVIGHAAMKKYGNFSDAMKYQNDICGSGYLHGIIEEKFAESADIVGDMQTICEPQKERSCYHGVGHGLMFFTDNDLPKSIELCENYETNEAKVGCAEGVFMENFNSNTLLHPTEYLNPENPFYPCGDQKDMYKAVCYFYAPAYYLTIHPNAYEEAMQWCLDAERGYEAACAKGVGSRVMKENIGNVELGEKTCNSQPDVTDPCIDGMVSYYIVNFASVQKGAELCEMISEQNKETCLNGVESRKYWYES